MFIFSTGGLTPDSGYFVFAGSTPAITDIVFRDLKMHTPDEDLLALRTKCGIVFVPWNVAQGNIM